MKQRLLLVTICCFCAGLTFAQKNTNLVTLRGETQGTTYQIKYLDDDQRLFKQEIERLLADIDRCVSNYRPDSEIAVFNQSHSIRFQRPYFLDLLQKSKEVYLATEGAFDPTIYPLVEAYGFGPDRQRNIPGNMDSLLNLVGFDKISFDSIAVAKSLEHVRLDFNAIAKGYTTDKIAELLAANNILNYLIEIGGEIRSGGEKGPDQPWKVGIENPFNLKSLSGTITLKNQGMATSGYYRNRYTRNGETFNHIINPRTGSYQASELFSATVVAPDAASADAYATAFMVMGPVKTIQLLASHPELGAYLIYAGSDGKTITFISENIRHKVRLNTENSEN